MIRQEKEDLTLMVRGLMTELAQKASNETRSLIAEVRNEVGTGGGGWEEERMA